MERRTFRRLIGITGIILFFAFIILISYFFVKKYGFLIKDPVQFRAVIRGYGGQGYIVYLLLYIIQIIFAPIPGQVLNISSGVLFGVGRGIIISWAAVFLGGGLATLMSRLLGRKILEFILDDKAWKFEQEITKRGLSFIFFLSVFPNPLGDGVFYLAGLTNIALRVLIPIIALGRLPGIVVWVLLGDKILRAGVAGWIFGILGSFAAVGLYLIFQKQFEAFFEKMVRQGRWLLKDRSP
jgi:uncharacterized membrane protein YdjX (TVP38/TMEM64 family)